MTTWRKELGRRDHEKLVGTRFRELWFPDLNAFDIRAVVPGLFYVMRTQRPRGPGCWVRTFAGPEGGRITTPRTVARRLLEAWGGAEGDGREAEEVLADWLAQAVLIVHERGQGRPRRDRKVMGLRPLHAALLRADLPSIWAHCRYVPEWVASLLSDTFGQDVQGGLGPRDRGLLEALGPGLELDEKGGAGDRVALGSIRDLDHRLAAALADALPEMPARGKGDFQAAARLTPQGTGEVKALLTGYVGRFAGVVPARVFGRHFVALLAACLAREFLAHVETVLHAWSTGLLEERFPSVVVDLSDGRHRGLVEASRRSFLRLQDRLRRYMVAFTGLRIAWRVGGRIHGPGHDATARIAALLRLSAQLRSSPPSEAALRLAGRLDDLQETVLDAAGSVWGADERRVEALQRRFREGSPLDTLASLVVEEIAENSHKAKAWAFLRGCAGYNLSEGLLRGPVADRARASVAFWRLSDPLLEALVHAWGSDRAGGRQRSTPLTVRAFIGRLERDLGLSLRIPDDPALTRRNEQLLRDRLAALGLFRNVSDAERMQWLQGVWPPREEA